MLTFTNANSLDIDVVILLEICVNKNSVATVVHLDSHFHWNHYNEVPRANEGTFPKCIAFLNNSYQLFLLFSSPVSLLYCSIIESFYKRVLFLLRTSLLLLGIFWFAFQFVVPPFASAGLHLCSYVRHLPFAMERKTFRPVCHKILVGDQWEEADYLLYKHCSMTIYISICS